MSSISITGNVWEMQIFLDFSQTYWTAHTGWGSVIYGLTSLPGAFVVPYNLRSTRGMGKLKTSQLIISCFISKMMLKGEDPSMQEIYYYVDHRGSTNLYPFALWPRTVGHWQTWHDCLKSQWKFEILMETLKIPWVLLHLFSEPLVS